MGWLYMSRGSLGGHASASAYLDAQFTYERQVEAGGTSGLRVLALRRRQGLGRVDQIGGVWCAVGRRIRRRVGPMVDEVSVGEVRGDKDNLRGGL